MKEEDIFEIALEIACKAHKGQVDKVGQPYILHPLWVANHLPSLELKSIALLHDVLEDTDLTTEDLKKAGIPDSIIWVVQVLTKDKSELYDDYILRVKNDPKASLVKMLDLEHNLAPWRSEGLTTTLKGRYERAKRILLDEI